MTHHGRTPDADDRLDRYYTPEWPVRALLEHDAWPLAPPATVAEPCAGPGHLADVLERYGYETVRGDLDPAVEAPPVDATDPEAVRERYGDVDAVVTNPPYSADRGTAGQVVRALLTLDVPTAVLTRVSFLEPAHTQPYRRHDLLPQMTACIVLPRVDFMGGGDDNSMTSAWCLWGTGAPCRHHTVTPEDVRRLRGG